MAWHSTGELIRRRGEYLMVAVVTSFGWREVAIPFTNGLDVYRPYGTGNGVENEYRKIRYNGRTLISFNPQGVEPVELQDIRKSVGDYCRVEGRWER
jgi:hypothetical protein